MVMIKYVAPVILVVLLISEAITRFKSPYGGYPRSAEFIGFLVMFVFIPLGAFILSKIKSKDKDIEKIEIT